MTATRFLALLLAGTAAATAGCGSTTSSPRPLPTVVTEAVPTRPTAPPGATMPRARRWVAAGVTGSLVGPKRSVVALKGKAPEHQRVDNVVVVSAERARKLFGLVAGSARTGRPTEPVTCADCGNSYWMADGAYFKPSQALIAEFRRLAGPGVGA